MMPVNPPAASASSSTAGNQKRRKMCLRSLGGALTIAVGRYAFRRLIGGLAAILFQPLVQESPGYTLTITCLRIADFGNVDSHSRSIFRRIPRKTLYRRQRISNEPRQRV